MKHLSILVPEGDVSITNIEGTHQIFSEVNALLKREGKPQLFHIQLVGLKKETRIKNGMFSIHPDVLIKDVAHTDLIIIPAIQSDMQQALDANADFIPWIIKQYHAGATLASLCIGSFLLAATGLLSGKKCATHWLAANDFRCRFPDVELVPDKIVTGEYGIYSSGGAYSSLNLVLYLVEKYAGREIAILCSKVFQIEIERNSQSAFMIFHAQKDHQDEAVKTAQEFIETHYEERITVDELSELVGVSRRNLERRFRKVTLNSINEYLQRVRIEAAKINLEKGYANVNEAMFKSGYTDIKAFRTTFKKITGLSPVVYRKKYNREPVE
jgi:transcriptional regulator GlxA family with amidase domain